MKRRIQDWSRKADSLGKGYMKIVQNEESAQRKPLRLWPGVVIVALQWLVRFGVPALVKDAAIIGLLGSVVGGVAVVVWWVFFSRAPRLERWAALPLMIVATLATRPLMHESIQNGMMGRMFAVFAVPTTLSLALVAWAAACRNLGDGARRLAMVVALLIGCGSWALFRTNGITGGGGVDLAWRWSPTAEERLLARTGVEPSALPEVGAAAEPAADWPGFRGPGRDSVIRGVRIETDWSQAPPAELWRRSIGPGWSSFAVRGDLLYTQEQRGDEEIVSCYRLMTGEPVWMHRDATRFWESNGGAGPRATPTLSGGRVYTFGATGILNALEADDGAVVWSRNVASDIDAKVPGWGFVASPLVIDDVVVIAASGALVGYDLATGERRWLVPSRGGSYSSPQLMTIDGVEQVVLMGGHGATSVQAADGALLWDYAWPGVPIVQPALLADDALLISTADAMGGMGMRRLAVAQGAGGWTVEEAWTSRGLKPYFNDFVVHEGRAFGFDGFILSCIDLESGTRLWKGGRYGNGQLVLLPDQDLLLVLSEEGELALVEAKGDRFTELARRPAIEGKTWNHPALVGDVLLVRNGQEMAAFRLSLAGS
jgi:outer membrane protein assembly factor BamB